MSYHTFEVTCPVCWDGEVEIEAEPFEAARPCSNPDAPEYGNPPSGGDAAATGYCSNAACPSNEKGFEYTPKQQAELERGANEWFQQRAEDIAEARAERGWAARHGDW